MHSDWPPSGGAENPDPRPAAPSRIVEIAGVANVRDAGGLDAADGTLRRGRLFRSANLASLADPAELYRLGIRTVVDLRRDDELERDPTPDLGAGVVIVRAPVDIHAQEVENLTHLIDLYDRIFSHHGSQLMGGIEAVADTVADGVLVHCSAGKDRTGLVIGLIQLLLGVSDEDVLDDYVMTNRYAAELLEPQKHALRQRWTEHFPDELFEAPPETLTGTLDKLRADHGTIAAAVRAHGLTNASIEKLRVALLAPARAA